MVALAAPLARDVIKAYFDKKNGVHPQFANRAEPNKQATVLRQAVRVGG